MRSLNPLDYSLAEIQKALIALFGFLGFAAFYLFNTDFDPGLVPALQALVPTGFAVISVFAATQTSEADVKKALIGFVSAGVGVFEALGQKQINPDTLETLLVMAGYLATFFCVYVKRNTVPSVNQGGVNVTVSGPGGSPPPSTR